MKFKNNFYLSPLDIDILKHSLGLLLSKRRWDLTGSYSAQVKEVIFLDAVCIKELILRLKYYGE